MSTIIVLRFNQDLLNSEGLLPDTLSALRDTLQPRPDRIFVAVAEPADILDDLMNQLAEAESDA